MQFLTLQLSVLHSYLVLPTTGGRPGYNLRLRCRGPGQLVHFYKKIDKQDNGRHRIIFADVVRVIYFSGNRYRAGKRARQLGGTWPGP